MTPLILLAAAIALLLLLVARLKINPFLALTLTSFCLAIATGLTAESALKSIIKGAGDTLGGIVFIIFCGAVIGKLIEESGAALAVSRRLIAFMGLGHIQTAMVITGIIVGLPMFYNAGFLVLTPLVYALSTETGLPLIHLGLPLSAALSVTHGFVPPHPGPTAVANILHADINRTLMYGLILAVPASILGGPVLSRLFRKWDLKPPPELYQPREFKDSELPSFSLSLGTILIPVILMLFGAVVGLNVSATTPLAAFARFASDANVALFVGMIVAIGTLGLARKRDMDSVMKSVGLAASSVAMLLLIIAGGGEFKQVLIDGGVAESLRQICTQLGASPILLAWGTAALIRFALGSATVAGITAAGIILPLVPHSGVRPELLVIAISTGSLMFSHFNDSGFWMFREYYNTSIKQTFQAWTSMECTVGTVGLIGTLILNRVLGPG